ncbi:MAG: pyridoxamine 5'-phosphate oxidase [bacterium]
METEANPIQLFKQLYEQVFQADVPESSAMTLATATPGGRPSARVVLLKGFDDRGFVFYTNLASRKAVDLQANPVAALCFYWEQIHYQVRVEGWVEQVTDAEADAYFATRPRGSQIGAWASKQSARLEKREALEAQMQKYTKRFEGKEVPRPTFWSGYRLVPEQIEFWERKENRLHARTLFVRQNETWKVCLLNP